MSVSTTGEVLSTATTFTTTTTVIFRVSVQDAVVSLSKSWSFQRSIEDKQRLKREQGEQAARSANDLEGERRLRLHEEGIRLEKERQQLKLRNLGSSDSLSADCEYASTVSGAL